MEQIHKAMVALEDPKLREAFSHEQDRNRFFDDLHKQSTQAEKPENTPASRKAAKKRRRRFARGLKVEN